MVPWTGLRTVDGTLKSGDALGVDLFTHRKGVLFGKQASEEEVAEAAVWLCSEAASYVTGHSMVVDGGKIA